MDITIQNGDCQVASCSGEVENSSVTLMEEGTEAVGFKAESNDTETSHLIKYTCDVCNQSFKRKALLKKHSLKHEGDKDTTCDICGMTFLTQSKLSSHRKTHRTGRTDSEHTCDQCGKHFTTKGNLQQHRNIHTGNKTFQCTKCVKCFLTKQTYEEHTHRHSKEKQVQCEQCGHRYYCQRELTRHMRFHTTHSDFPCKICKMFFKDATSLTRHNVKIHSQMYSCIHCDRQFMNRRTLHAHVIEDHQDRGTSRVKTPRRLLANFRKVLCKLCGLILSNKYRLQKHLLNKHQVPKEDWQDGKFAVELENNDTTSLDNEIADASTDVTIADEDEEDNSADEMHYLDFENINTVVITVSEEGIEQSVNMDQDIADSGPAFDAVPDEEGDCKLDLALGITDQCDDQDKEHTDLAMTSKLQITFEQGTNEMTVVQSDNTDVVTDPTSPVTMSEAFSYSYCKKKKDVSYIVDDGAELDRNIYEKTFDKTGDDLDTDKDFFNDICAENSGQKKIEVLNCNSDGTAVNLVAEVNIVEEMVPTSEETNCDKPSDNNREEGKNMVITNASGHTVSNIDTGEYLSETEVSTSFLCYPNETVLSLDTESQCDVQDEADKMSETRGKENVLSKLAKLLKASNCSEAALQLYASSADVIQINDEIPAVEGVSVVEISEGLDTYETVALTETADIEDAGSSLDRGVVHFTERREILKSESEIPERSYEALKAVLVSTSGNQNNETIPATDGMTETAGAVTELDKTDTGNPDVDVEGADNISCTRLIHAIDDNNTRAVSTNDRKCYYVAKQSIDCDDSTTTLADIIPKSDSHEEFVRFEHILKTRISRLRRFSEYETFLDRIIKSLQYSKFRHKQKGKVHQNKK